MKTLDFTTAILTEQNPEEVFNAINNVRRWWTGEPGIEGSTDKLNDEFTYGYNPYHYSKQKVTELIPGLKIVWLVTDSKLGFVFNKTEWTGTEITFDITRKGNNTEVRFTHMGLVPGIECYGSCSNAWGSYISGSLLNWITESNKAT